MKKKSIAEIVANKEFELMSRIGKDKNADAYGGNVSYILDDDRTEVLKAEDIPKSVTKIKVRSIINTTKLYDSHGDVHIDQLWNKSLKDNRKIYLLNKHERDHANVISRNVHAFTKQIPWIELGLPFEGNTQALIFDSIIDSESMGSNARFLFDDYRKGYVDQHSVGMKYVELTLAVNDDRYKEEFKAWEKFFPEVANKEDAFNMGYFWAVTQAKIIEGSAVLMGANYATPTLHVEEKTEPVKATQQEPMKVTPLAASDLINFYTIKI